MYSINDEGHITDYQGFMLKETEMRELIAACEKSIAVGAEQRAVMAREHCESAFPEMLHNVNFDPSNY